LNEKVQQYLVIFVGVIVIGGVIYIQLRRARPAPPVSATMAAAEPAPESASPPPALAGASLPESIAGRPLTPGPTLDANQTPTTETVLLETGEWGRDPFMTFDEIAALVPQPVVVDIVEFPPPVLPPTVAPPALPDYTVSAIVSGENGNWAVIGARVVRTGDRLGSETIKLINENGVILELNGKTRELRISRPGRLAPGTPRGSNQ
jgi:hypothetical protein